MGAGERILWAGSPVKGIRLRGSDIFVIPFSLLWGGFAFFWEYSVYKTGAPPFFLLFGGVFVVVGIHMIFGRFIVDAMQRGKTTYAVSNERVLVLNELFGRKLKSLDLQTLSDVSLIEKSNGIGTITFGPMHPMSSMAGGTAWPGAGQFTGSQFELIDDVKTVYETIRRAQNDSR